MYGWRGKIGHAAPSRGDLLVYEFYRMLPEGFMILNTTGTIRKLVDTDFEKQIERFEEATLDLVASGADVVIVGGAPLFAKLGYGFHRDLGENLTEKAGVPVFAGITGEVEALKAMGIKKAVVATPYPEESNRRMEKFLTDAGFQVLRIGGAGIVVTAEISEQPSSMSYRIAKKLYFESPEADGVFMPCNRWPVLEHVALLEREIGKPVVTAGMAYIWYALKLINARVDISGFGKLMETLR
jgi:maleate cis-trans isomerase